jgi:transmembrane sensor
MKDTYSKDLFAKYASGNCTEEEQAIVEGWYLNEMRQNNTRPSAGQLNTAEAEIWKAIKPKHRINPVIKWASLAAAVLLAVLFVYKLQPQPAKKVTNEAIAAKNNPVPEVYLASVVENKMIKLSDGSIVILEKGSKLSLLPAFNKNSNREVRLLGKGFFDIAHDPAKPFIIYSGSVRTKVIGTAFDITAIPGSGTVKVNVIRGLVEVRGGKSGLMTYLKKNMQAVFDAGDSIISRKPVNAAKELAWNQGDIEFDEVSLADAKPRLEEQFGYQITVEDPTLRQATFTYSMRAKESPESFIKSICEFIGASYTINHKNKTIIIKPLNH